MPILRNRSGISHWTKVISVCLWIVSILCQPASAAHAGLPSQSSPGLDIVLLIDNSGSMSGNDPQGYRWSAAQLFIDLARPGDRIAGYVFETSVIPLTSGSLQVIGDVNSRQTLKQSFDLGSANKDGATNILLGMRAAMKSLEDRSAGNEALIVLLTDGNPNPSSQVPELEDLVQQAGERQIKVFPILLGDDIDPALGEKYATWTGGLWQKALTAQDLLSAFSRVFTYIRPERYADVLNERGGVLSFKTNPTQGITDFSLIIARENPSSNPLGRGTLNSSSFEYDGQLPDGAFVEPVTEARHYQLVTVHNNAPLEGEWRFNSNSGQSALILVTSAVTLDIPHPRSSTPKSTVAPRFVPTGRPVFITGRALQNGAEISRLPMSVVVPQGDVSQILGMSTEGLSSNNSVFWTEVDLSGQPDGKTIPHELQVGSEVDPFRLRKTFLIKPVNAPHLVLDSPDQGGRGLASGGFLRIAAHVEGATVSSTAMTAWVLRESTAAVTEIVLTCSANQCEDQSFQPDLGETYQVTVLGSYMYDGLLISDGERRSFTTGSQVRIDGLSNLETLLSKVPGTTVPSLPLQVTAFMPEGRMPELQVRLTDLQPDDGSLQITAVLEPLTQVSERMYSTSLKFIGAENLPPGTYTTNLEFRVVNQPDTEVFPAQFNFSFVIPESSVMVTGFAEPGMSVGCAGLDPAEKNLLDFGVLVDPAQQVRTRMNYETRLLDTPPRMEAVILDAHSVAGGPQDQIPLQLSLGQYQQVDGASFFPLFLELPPGLADGEYVGTMELKSLDGTTKVSPPYHKFRFVVRSSWSGRLLYQAGHPVVCFTRGILDFNDWTDSLWFIIPALVLLMGSYRGGARARLIPEVLDLKALEFSSNRPVYFLVRNKKIMVSTSPRDRDRAVGWLEVARPAVKDAKPGISRSAPLTQFGIRWRSRGLAVLKARHNNGWVSVRDGLVLPAQIKELVIGMPDQTGKIQETMFFHIELL